MEEQLTKKELKKQKQEERAEIREAEEQKKKAGQRNTWIIAIVSAIVIVAGITWLIQNRPESARVTDSTPDVINEITERDWTKGGDAETAKVTIVEYSDFQCPACGFYYPMAKQLVEESGTDIQFVYRHLPLLSHPNAELAAMTAEAAGLQGKFWEMHDLLFDTQSDWSDLKEPRETFLGYGEQLGLDTEKLNSDMDLEEISDKIAANRKDGLGAGVNSTPTFFINGEKVVNPRTIDDFRTLINETMNSDESPDNSMMEIPDHTLTN